MGVSILVVLDDALVLFSEQSYVTAQIVSILVVLDDALVQHASKIARENFRMVSILVVLDDALVQN